MQQCWYIKLSTLSTVSTETYFKPTLYSTLHEDLLLAFSTNYSPFCIGQKWSTAHAQFTFIPVMVFAVPCENMRRYMLAAGQAGMANGDYAFVQLDHEVKPFIDSDSIFSVSLTFSWLFVLIWAVTSDTCFVCVFSGC